MDLLSGLPTDTSIILVSGKSFDLVYKHLPFHKIFIIENFDFNALMDLNCNLILLKISFLFKKKLLRLNIRDKCVIFNPLYDLIGPYTKLINFFFSSRKKKFYARQMKSVFAEMLSMELPLKTTNTIIKKNIIGFHVAGADSIRKLRPSILRQVIVSRPDIKFFLLGSSADFDEYKSLQELRNVINLIGKIELIYLSDILTQMDAVVCPDSMVMHYADYLGVPVIAIMGNALVETYGPYNDGNIIITRNPACSPCGKISCEKFIGYSCVQDISSTEILILINSL